VRDGACADIQNLKFSIHGGGYVGGSAPFSYPGDALVSYGNGSIIFVGIQYRLGMFGFMGGDAISQNGALNAGLLDQRAAMEWVQRNVSADQPWYPLNAYKNSRYERSVAILLESQSGEAQQAEAAFPVN
jgi:hypothetical protein